MKDEIEIQLVKLLKEIFRFEKGDLDFGIYRLINLKKKEVSKFIEKELFELIKKEISEFYFKKINTNTNKNTNNSNEKGNASISTIIRDNHNNTYYDILNLLLDFFSYYYSNGDFVAQKRYSKKGKYLIPYNGDEVYLYWANQDQYYIKSSEDFNQYSFKIGYWKINFKINKNEIHLEKANIKDSVNKFLIFSNLISNENNTLDIFFSYRSLSEIEIENIKKTTRHVIIKHSDVNLYNIHKIYDALSSIEINDISGLKNKHKKINGEFSEKSELEWHLEKFTTKNKSDYFIHKNLKLFLSEELDLYINNEVLDVDSLSFSENFEDELKKIIIKIKVFKRISLKIIDFLSQIEEFLKLLWEKKKFVLSTNYLITLDFVNERYYNDIIKNDEQIEEWKRLGIIHGEIKEINEAFLKANPSLCIDTKFFTEEFKYSILGEIDDLDKQLSGILINSDNFHGLNLLQEKYKGKIDWCYIDPPYNIAGDDFLYKDSFQHSSWLTMMDNRIRMFKPLLTKNGIFFSSIDDEELSEYSKLIENIFPEKLKNIIWHKKTQPSFLSKELIPVTEYIIIAKNSRDKLKLFGGFGDSERYVELINIGNKIEIRELSKKAVIVNNDWNGILENGKYGKNDLQIELLNGPIKIINGIPQKNLVLKGRFKWNQDRIDKEISKGAKIHIKSIKSLRPLVKRIRDAPIIKAPITLLSKKINKEIPTNTDATNELKKMFGISPFDYSKPVDLIKYLLNSVFYFKKEGIAIDFFAGSGTTADAILKLKYQSNQEKEQQPISSNKILNLQFILIEMGKHFNSILKPRIIKRIYCPEWNNGVALKKKVKKSNNKGNNYNIEKYHNGLQKQIIKYHTLEQFEDSLQNINLQNIDLQNIDLLNINIYNKMKIISRSKDYKHKYMLNFESKNDLVFINLEMIKNPFDYKIKIESHTGEKMVKVDLIETFNYIAGIFVKSIKTLYLNNNGLKNRYVIVKGLRFEKKVIVIWRNISRDFSPELDKQFIEKNVIQKEKFDEIFVNHNSLVNGAISLDILFKKKLIFE